MYFGFGELLIMLILQGFACYWIGYRVGKDYTMKFISCAKKEATHVKIIDEDLQGTDLTFGEVYEYLYDPHPSEETYYVIQNNGIPFYDFECVIKVDYLKKID
ncbi:hypothetical protein ABDI04_04825 [Bacillus licheniformis]|uniref:hypothetical protein n=1 Tax=Bacillus haynesii TaxID=1925021 RepID=UPI00227DF319|nr:hypothetical protein [Bacillus haynesii]MCY8549442.1 hypothetical protein [Bacillus haynesii]